MRGPRGMVGRSELEGYPAVPGATGGLSRREVHWYRSVPTRAGQAEWYCVRVAPIRVAFRRGIDAAVVGAGPAQGRRRPAGSPNPA